VSYRDFKIKFKIILIPTIIFGLLFASGCTKNGMGLKIGDQDVLALGAVQTCNFVQNSQGLRVSWKSSIPARLIISNTVPVEFDDTIKAAANAWNNGFGTNLIEVVRDDGVSAKSEDDGKNVIIWSTEWPTEIEQEQARTAIRWEISKLLDADIKINAQDYSFVRVDQIPEKSKIDLLSLMIHEMGHALGLKHISDPASVMQVYLTSAVRRDKPSEIELQSLRCEY
jgi:predicted Zn-dependent protease